ncbi:DUF2759 domain-containing protein [Bacillus aquiflavi]|uniref:DUF2759 domain-containing protein n=1 Tax=Bacillus aquiflavi TaxID=2672567 RepID=A0A6B3VQE8_9BACI|nr:DUF2759 domain-containing protein [Bacillus aquiflavi]MBA4535813.1 DUF2759 domain-containing protein [Bacillus aquiflavi]NEY80189.1 DUF2759 domain-containing protein [Bacillus aquiflavi]UAC47240.1 DUF2759 domain-containing protein [Bacillus aquiflavi]
MGLVIIFGLVTILAAFGSISALKNKNFLGAFFGIGTLAVFGWFTFMTVLKSGYPVA